MLIRIFQKKSQEISRRCQLCPNGTELQESEAGWLLPVADQQVTRCCLDYAEVGLLLANGININISQAFFYVRSGGTEFGLNPEGEGMLLAPILRVMRMNVKSGTAFKDGRLRVVFEDNSHVEVPPSQEFEAWNIAGPDGLLIVSTPGGDHGIAKVV
jgi:hypothetical protein